jgi:hypothetical protein
MERHGLSQRIVEASGNRQVPVLTPTEQQLGARHEPASVVVRGERSALDRLGTARSGHEAGEERNNPKAFQ